MELTLESLVQILTIIGFAAAVMKYVVIEPLKTAITTLKEALDEMKRLLRDLSDEQKNVVQRLVAVEESTKSAHKRLDAMEHVLQ